MSISGARSSFCNIYLNSNRRRQNQEVGTNVQCTEVVTKSGDPVPRDRVMRSPYKRWPHRSPDLPIRATIGTRKYCLSSTRIDSSHFAACLFLPENSLNF